MILDLHAHSVKSDDGRAKVANYCQWIRKKEIPIDGFVLSEHRQFDFESDYSDLAKEHGLCILKASEVGNRVRPYFGLWRNASARARIRLWLHTLRTREGHRGLRQARRHRRAGAPGSTARWYGRARGRVWRAGGLAHR